MSMTQMTRRTALGLAAAGGLAALVGCSSTSDTATTTTSAGQIPTVTEGKLTVATGQPAYSPWVEDDKPQSGKGFEAAVAYAVAGKLGFAAADVVWVRTSFDAAIAPGAKNWDFNLQQFSITDERKKAVDMSEPYYTTAQAVIATKGSKAASATTLAGLADVQFGVQAGTTSQTVLANSVKTSKKPLVFNSSQDTVQALKGGQVDAIVTDLPTAIYITAAQYDKGTIVGQFASTTGGDKFGLVLPKGSKLTSHVDAAIKALTADGTLAKLQKQWLSDSIKAPVLK